MRIRSFFLLALVVAGLLVVSGCTQSQPVAGTPTPQVTAGSTTPATVTSPETPGAAAGKYTVNDLITLVNKAVAYAKTNGNEKAIAAFNDPNGEFAQNGLYVFAEGYNGTALAEPFERDTVGTNILGLKDSYGVPLIKNIGETARYGMGYVSYEYPNPANNKTVEQKLSVVADVDGTYYVGAGFYESNGMVYPSVVLNPSAKVLSRDDLVAFVKNATDYARKNGKEKAIATFNDKNGPFVQGELVIMAFDYNGTNLVSPPYSKDLSQNHINLINYHDPDGIATIRGMRDLSENGGGILYTVAKISENGKMIFAPKIDYAEPVDSTWWLFSGIYDPAFRQLRSGDLTGITVRNHSRQELYALVDRAVTYAKTNGQEKALAEINSPKGQFVQGDVWVWAEAFNGTLLADPYWKAGIGQDLSNYRDPNGQMTTLGALDAIHNGTGFMHQMFPDTANNSTRPVPKLVFMKAVDDQWWIGGGIYGVEVE